MIPRAFFRGLELGVFDYTFLVDQRVNIVRDLDLEQALIVTTPENLREAVREEYHSWHEKTRQREQSHAPTDA